MSRVIHHHAHAVPAVDSTQGHLASGQVLDALRRPLRDLRISVTDRCNFRCSYCMPRDVFDKTYAFLPHSSLLTFEEIVRVARVSVAMGVRKIRLTGGEPLMRRDLERLVAQLAQLRMQDGQPVELAMTTNGAMLARKAVALKAAGLHRVTVSLDGLDDNVFRQMSDSAASVQDVLRGIDAAAQAGLTPIKINMVVRKGRNDSQILPMAQYFRGSGHVLRFIEYMDVGTTNGWKLDEVMSSQEIHDRIHAIYPLQAIASSYRGEVAQRWRYADGAGEIGIISSVTHPFCGDCTRARLSPEGKLFLCLFADRGHDLRALLRSGASDETLAAQLASIWIPRNNRYSEIRGQATARANKIEMSYIGG